MFLLDSTHKNKICIFEFLGPKGMGEKVPMKLSDEKRPHLGHPNVHCPGGPARIDG